MGFWKESSEIKRAPRLIEGQQRLTIKRIIYEKNDEPIITANGDRQIWLIVGPDSGEEGLITITLTEKAGWVLAQVARAIAGDQWIDKWDKIGVKIGSFANPAVANNLVGKSFLAEVHYDKKSEYPNITPLPFVSADVSSTAPAKAPAKQTMTDDDIPF